MNQARVHQVLKNMTACGLSQMVISDPYSVFYLTGRFIEPGERLLALYLNTNGSRRILINRLFTVPEDLGVEKLWFSDTDDSMALLKSCIDPASPLGIDKNMPARFLLPMINSQAAAAFVEASDCVDMARSGKDEAERELMREASRINDRAMAQFAKNVHAGVTERELAESMEKIYCSLGAEGHSFSPLVGFGKNAAIGHHEPDDTMLREGDCVLIDVGCRYQGYCSDMTRTFFYKGVSPHQRAIYDLVLRANETAESIIHPGTRFCDIDKSGRDIIEKAGYGPNFTHRIGHSIGMEVHEKGDVSCANTDAVGAGMTFSVEPGIYLEEDVGVRIEDLVLVTETGHEILNSYTKELQILE